MMRVPTQVLMLLTGALALGCTSDKAGNDNDVPMTSTTHDLQTGSGSSAPGSTNEGSDDSTPTMATVAMTTLDTTSEACSSLCQDMPGECNTWEQDCPEGQKCAPYVAFGFGWNGARCVEVTGMDTPGDPCNTEDPFSGIDNCAKGAICWHVDQNGIGICVALCSGDIDNPFCESAGTCNVAADGFLALCMTRCDPLLQDCPTPAEACYPTDLYDFNCLPDKSGDTGHINDQCEFSNTCDEGLICRDVAFVGMGCMVGSPKCCTPFCTFPNGACPNPDQQCVQYFDPLVLQPDDPQLEIGVCGVPN